MDIWRQLGIWCSLEAVCLKVVKIVKSVSWLLDQSWSINPPHRVVVKSRWNEVYKILSLMFVLPGKYHLKCCPRVGCMVVNQLVFVQLGWSDAVKSPSIPWKPKMAKLYCHFLLLKGHSSEHKGFTLITSSKSNYLPKSLPLNTIVLKIRTSSYEFWGYKIQSLTGLWGHIPNTM